MPTFIQNYIDKLNINSILEELFSKSVSLVLLFIVFYIVKIILHQVVKRVVKPSLKFSQKDEARQKTISRLIENILNYTLYFFLLYFVLSTLGLPVSSLLAGAGFFILFERQLDVGDQVEFTNGPITISGKVVSVGIRTTQLRSEDGVLHFVPNRSITVVSNFSRKEEN